MQWTDQLIECAKAPLCNDTGSERLFQHKLDQLTQSLLALGLTLAAWPGQPHVLWLQYPDPFGADLSCLHGTGLAIPNKVATMERRLRGLNQVIASVANGFHQWVAQPDFSAGPLCSSHPLVQDLTSKAPFHPTADGQWVIENKIMEVIERKDPQLLVQLLRTGRGP